MSHPVPILSISVEDQIVRYLHAKNDRAIELIFENYSLAMMNVIRSVVKNEAVAEDVLQKVLVKIWEKGDSFDPQKAGLYTWLIRISKNAAIDETRGKDFLRSRKSESVDNFVFNGEAIHQKSVQERKNGVWESVNQLPDAQRCLIDMAYFQGYTQKEISQELNLPLGTVKTRMRKAISTLRRIF
ncbi:MAG: sigma-70 family RNA polymerase sigma factor [bacterium]|nr:sigma-70 family RNA polymerase sigma factor [bacterium]